MIDHTRCLAPRNKNSRDQCPHRRRFGDFCGIDSSSCFCDVDARLSQDGDDGSGTLEKIIWIGQ